MSLVSSIYGAEYGKNKVQFERFEWKFLQTEHFDVYFYPGGERIAEYTGRYVQSMYDHLNQLMGHHLQQRVPIIIHNTHSQFQQTNVIPVPLPEAVGGFTELYKNRMVLPFDGSYRNYHHVLHHELVHAMIFDYFSGGPRGNSALGALPLWMHEGLAEYASLGGWDVGSEKYMIDAVTHGYVPSPTMNFQGFLAYRAGQSFLVFLETAFGEGTIRGILRKVRGGMDFMDAFKDQTQVSLKEAGEIWIRELRRIYWPELGKRTYAKTVSRQLTSHGEDQSYYNVAPTISPDGKKVAFISDRGNWEAIYVMDVETEKIQSRVLESGHLAEYESFNTFKSWMNWSPDGRYLSLATQKQGRDVIQILDVEKEKVVETLDPGVEAIASASFSPDGKSLVFSAVDSGRSDLWMMERESKKVTRLTNDKFQDDNPTFSPNGQFIAFESNRAWPDSLDPQINKQDIYVMDLQSKSVRRRSVSKWNSHSPAWVSGDSLLSFVSDRSGVENVYIKNLKTDSLWAVTNLLSGVQRPTWSKDAELMSFALFEGGGWDVFLMKSPLHKGIQLPLPKTHFMEVSESDSLTFFRDIPLENMSSYKDTSVIKLSQVKDSSVVDSATVDSSNINLSTIDSSIDTPGEVTIIPDTTTKDSALSRTEQSDGDTTANNLVSKPDKHSRRTNETFRDGDGLFAPRTREKVDVQKDDANRPAPDSIRSAKEAKGIFLKDSMDYLNADGSFRVREYSPKFSLDRVIAVAGYDNLNGLGGQGALALSDLMGDHELNFWFYSNGGSLTDISGFAGYAYKPWRWDLHVQGFNYARSDYRSSSERAYADSLNETPMARTWPDSVPVNYDSLMLARPPRNELYFPYDDHYYGVIVGWSWPFSIFSRVRFDAEYASRNRSFEPFGVLYFTEGDTIMIDYPAWPEKNRNTLLGRASWSFDNARWGISGPIQGSRLAASFEATPPGWLDEDLGFYSGDADFRQYWRFGKKYTFAARVAGGFSNSWPGYDNPKVYLAGGDQMTLNWHFNESNYSRSLDDVFFSSWQTPLRGYKYHDFRGNRMSLINLEFRYPFIREFSIVWPIPLAFRYITGVLFTDFGGAWDGYPDWRQDFGHGWGWGMRMNLGIFVLRYTLGWSSNHISPYDYHGAWTYWSLGAEF